MAVTIGINAGFVTETPTGDPNKDHLSIDTRAFAQKDTSPATATTITEVGWYSSLATEEANFEVGLYSSAIDGEFPLTRLEVDNVNAKGTTLGWKSVAGLNWSINSETIYWIAIQLDNTATTSATELGGVSVGDWYAYTDNETSLPATWTEQSNSGFFPLSIYAVWEAEEEPPEPSFTAVNIGDTWKTVSGSNVIKVNVGDAWKNVTSAKVNIGDAWKAVTIS